MKIFDHVYDAVKLLASFSFQFQTKLYLREGIPEYQLPIEMVKTVKHVKQYPACLSHLTTNF